MNRNIMRGVKSRSHKCFMNFHLSFSYIALNNLYMMWKASLLNHDFVWGLFSGGRDEGATPIRKIKHINHSLATTYFLWLVVDLPHDDIPNIWNNNPNVPNHQPVFSCKNHHG